jgi:hypothetical protein
MRRSKETREDSTCHGFLVVPTTMVSARCSAAIVTTTWANNPTSGTPGARDWRLAPVSMLWQGLSVAHLCRALKNPKLNGNRTPEALIEHMETEPLLLWSWNPGCGRESIPIPHRNS